MAVRLCQRQGQGQGQWAVRDTEAAAIVAAVVKAVFAETLLGMDGVGTEISAVTSINRSGSDVHRVNHRCVFKGSMMEEEVLLCTCTHFSIHPLHGLQNTVMQNSVSLFGKVVRRRQFGWQC